MSFVALISETADPQPPSPLMDAFIKLYQGLSLIGDAVTTILTFACNSLGVQIPPLAIRVATIILVILTLWKLSNVVSKIVLYAMIFLLISLVAGMIPAIGELFV